MNVENFIEIVLRLLLAAFLGGLIGFEREYTKRPAGFRTHILVCVGSALVMLTSEFILNKLSVTDPARLGAQVISGIGFLGAGTIIRDGFNVTGLTTAASLWAVSCVGIAAGIGFYGGAVAATILIFLTLIILKKAEKSFAKKNRLRTYIVESENIPGQIGSISSLMEEYGVKIREIQQEKSKEENKLLLRLMVKLPQSNIDLEVVNAIQKLNGVSRISEE